MASGVGFQRFLLISIGDKRAGERIGKSSNVELSRQACRIVAVAAGNGPGLI